MNISQILTKLKSLVYSKSEADTLLSSKASSSHKHTKSEITDFPTIPTKTSQLTNDSGFLTAHQSLSDYSTKANTVKSLSISGKTITVTPGSGNAYTLTTQDTTYTLPTASSTLGGVKTTSTVSNSSGYTACPIISGVPYYKDTNTTYSLSSLGIGNVKNYDQSKAIKSISRSGTTFTYTCLDGTTGTFTQQDNNTTYSFSDKNVTLAWGTKSTIATVGGTDIHVTMPANPNTNTWTAMKGATSSANGSVGYVNAVPPKDGYNTKYLRADGTWQVPPDHTYTVNNATLTIQKNGSNVATFTANASSNVTANITVPTKVSQLTNDSGFITSSGSCNYANSAGSVAWSNVSGRPSSLVPVGSYIQFAGSQAPAGFLVCNGGAISRTTYSALFAVIGTKYGSGDGSTTFNLPNLTDRFLQGSTTSGTVKNAGLPNITGHSVSGSQYFATATFGALTGRYGGATRNITTYDATSQYANELHFNASNSNSIYGNSDTVQPPALTCLICIKY